MSTFRVRKNNTMNKNTSIHYGWLEPWDPDIIPDLQELIFQLTESREKAKRFTSSILRSMFHEQKTYVAIAIDEQSGKIIGMGTLIVHQTMAAKKAWIEDVVTHTCYRKKGIGHRIQAMLEQRARFVGADYIDLTSGTNRTDARRLYRSLGYEPRQSTLFRKKLSKSAS